MADKDVATGTWQCARVTGIAAALVLSMAVTPAEAKTPSPAHGAPGATKGQKNGASQGQKVRTRGNAPSPKKSTPSPTKSRGRSDHGRSEREPKPDQATPPNSHAKAGKTTICHSTGSATNPYVEITISDNALPAHARHHDGRDIIPAPAEGCETGAAQGVDEQTGSEDVESGVLGRRRTNRVSDVERADERRKRDKAAGGVLGVEESNAAPQIATQPVAEEDDEGGSLPFTGLALGAVLLMAIVAVATGAALRRASRELE